MQLLTLTVFGSSHRRAKSEQRPNVQQTRQALLLLLLVGWLMTFWTGREMEYVVVLFTCLAVLSEYEIRIGAYVSNYATNATAPHPVCHGVHCGYAWQLR